MNAPDSNSITAALDERRMVSLAATSIFSYRCLLADYYVKLIGYLCVQLSKQRGRDRTFRAANTEWQTFQTTVKLVHPGTDFSAPVLWRDYMINFMTRMTQWVRPWVNSRLLELEADWQQVDIAAPNQATRTAARQILGQISALREDLIRVVDFDVSVFVFISGL
jgi:chitinase